MLAQNSPNPEYDTDNNWAIEQKLDGHRLLTHPQIGILNRQGQPYAQPIIPALREEIRQLEHVLDGELVDGHYWVFDAPTHQTDGQASTYDQRRSFLETHFEDTNFNRVHLVPTAITTDDKQKLIAAIHQQNGEGYIAKRRNSVYQQTRSADMIKVKFVKTIDCIVNEVRPEGKQSISLALLHRSDDWPSEERLGQLSTGQYVFQVGRCLMNSANLHQAKPGKVAEIQYLYGGVNGRLYQPKFVRYRNDKLPTECDTDQWIATDKTVIPTLRQEQPCD